MKALQSLLTCLIFIVTLSNLAAQITFENAFPNLSFTLPVEIQNSGVSGDDRLFVVEQQGIIRVFDNDPNTASSTVFLDIRSLVSFESNKEMGLLGLAFHPDYASNGYFYVHYTSLHSSNNIQINVSRFTRMANNMNQADPNSECNVLTEVKNQENDNHNGGKITFGPDGYLYISIGDGGGQGDPEKNAQNTSNLFGAISRIDINTNCPSVPYAIPNDNPLVGSAGRDEIYAWGIRNTWKMSFDPNTNRLWGGDVGQEDRCEINLIQNGGNYGWNRFEGNLLEDVTTPDPGNAIFPVFDYDYEQDDRSITGGYVYRGAEIISTNPSIQGQYIFGDYNSGRVWALDYDPSTGTATRTQLFNYDGFIASFGLDINGEIYFTNYSTGVILKLVDGETPPSASPVNGVGTWCNLSTGTDGTIYSLAADANGNIYAGGDFTNAGGVVVNNIASWNGTNWSGLSTGANGRVNALVFDSNGNLYAGGAFTQIGGVSANNIARWNGTSWSALGSGTNGPVAALVVDSNNQLYVGGAFETVDGSISANNVARWSGSSWSNLTDTNTGINGTNNEIRSIEVDENNVLYVGGNFGRAGGVAVNSIAQWNGTVWSGLGTGATGFVEAITASPNYIYAGGIFPQAGGVSVNRIARYNRSSQTWESINNGLNGRVNTITLNNNYLYAGGSFASASNSSSNNIVVNGITRRNNGDWEALGEGTNVGVENVVRDLLFVNNTLYVAGTFSYAGATSNSANNFSCWNESVSNSCQNLVVNGDFSNGTTAWEEPIFFEGFASGSTAVVNGELNVDITNGGSEEFHVQFYQLNIPIESGRTYTLSFDARCASNTRALTAILHDGTNDPIWYTDTVVTLNTGMQSFSWTFTSSVTNPQGRFSFYMGNEGANDVIIDNVSICTPTPSSCPNTLAMNISPITSGTYSAIDTLTSIGRIAANEVVIFEAGRVITLSPGFEAANNSTFTARIQACANTSSASKQIVSRTMERTTSNTIAVYPNPFTASTTIALELIEDTKLAISLIDLTGKEVAQILPLSPQKAGKHLFQLNANRLDAGIYFLRVRIGEQLKTRKISIVK